MIDLGRAVRGAVWIALFLGTGCGSSHSSPPSHGSPPGTGGSDNGPSSTGLVAGGTRMQSAHYQLVGSMADGTVGTSNGKQLRSGVIGAAQ